MSSAGQSAEIWQAWLSDYTKPLDQILKESPAASNICIPGATRAMLAAHSGRHILSDNALFNCGTLQGNVVAIDVGSCESSDMTKGEFNKECMKHVWSKAQTLAQPAEPGVYKNKFLSIFYKWPKLYFGLNAQPETKILNSLPKNPAHSIDKRPPQQGI